MRWTEPQKGEELTELELVVLWSISQGKQHKYIARELNYSVPWVKTTMRRIRFKLGASTTPQAVVIALRQGLIT